MSMNNDQIKNRVAELRNKVFSLWANEGKWDGNNPNAPLYGLDRDPLVAMLLTAVAYQELQIENDIENYRKGMVSEFEDTVLPFHLTKASPAITMMTTAKAQGNKMRCIVGDNTDFTLQKDSFMERVALHFCPLFESNIIGATVTDITPTLNGQWKLTLEVTDEKALLGGVGFFFKGIEFEELVMHLGDKEISLINPWEYDRFPMNPNFSFWNLLYNQSLVFGTNEQWFDLWAEQSLQYYMVDPYASVLLNQGTTELTLEFIGLKSKNIATNNVFINSFPAVNVTQRSFALTPSDPLVKIADDNDFFMNLVGEYDTLEEADKFILRRYGCERFGFAELLRLADELQKRNATDFYAFQQIPSFQNSDKMRKLKVLLKDILAEVNRAGSPKTGVYALLKENAKVEVSIPLKALYTDGAKGNDIQPNAQILSVPTELDLEQTRILIRSSGGRDEVTNADQKKRLAQYYTLTNDKIVTRSDLKSFCLKELYRYDINSVDRIEVAQDEDQARTVVAFVSGVNPELDLQALQQRVERLIEVHSSGLTPVKLMIVNS